MTRLAWSIPLAGLILAALGWYLDPHVFYGGWLAAVVLVVGWPLGSIAVLLAHSLTGGRWCDALRPALMTGVCALPLLLPALLPLAAGLPDLYAWAGPQAHPSNGFYLNVPFFAERSVAYLVVWFVLGGLVLRGGALNRIAPVGLFLLAITVTFAAIDTIMSLDPHFTSSVFGMITAVGMGLLALSVAMLLTAATTDAGADLGKLLLALVILWIYLDFMQLLIVWQSDLAADASWYLDRARGFWGAVYLIIVAGHFVLPFALLLSPRMQRSRRVVTTVAALLVAMEVLHAWWSVLPSLGRGLSWIDFASMTGLGGTALGVARWAARRPVIERRINRSQRSLSHV